MSATPTHTFATHHRAILEELGSPPAQPFTLCMVAHSQGSTYRKAGALALVTCARARRGVISGGCLESDLETVAAATLAEDRPRLAVFDTQSDDDLVFGSGSGCRGRMQVLLWPVRDAARHPLCAALLAADRAHLPLRGALVTSGPQLGAGFLWYGDAEIALEPRAELSRSLKDATVGEHLLADESTCAVLSVAPSPRVMVVGAGPEAPALIGIAAQLGWRVTISDHREVPLRTHGAGAERLILAHPAAALDSVPERFDAVIVMTHTAARDREALASLSARSEAFIGLLGPPARRDELLRELDAASRAALAPRLHAPVGLKLGGYGPEVLALSICAELQHFLASGQ